MHNKNERLISIRFDIEQVMEDTMRFQHSCPARNPNHEAESQRRLEIMEAGIYQA